MKVSNTTKSFNTLFYIVLYTIIFSFFIPKCIIYLYTIPAPCPILYTGLDATDALSYYFSFIGAFATIALGVVALYQNKVFKLSNDESQELIKTVNDKHNNEIKKINEELLSITRMKYRIEFYLTDYTYERNPFTSEPLLFIYFTFNNIYSNPFIYNINIELLEFTATNENNNKTNINFTDEDFTLDNSNSTLHKSIVKQLNTVECTYIIDTTKNQFTKVIYIDNKYFNFEFCNSNWELQFKVTYENTIGDNVCSYYTFQTGFSQSKDYIKLINYKEEPTVH